MQLREDKFILATVPEIERVHDNRAKMWWQEEDTEDPHPDPQTGSRERERDLESHPY